MRPILRIDCRLPAEETSDGYRWHLDLDNANFFRHYPPKRKSPPLVTMLDPFARILGSYPIGFFRQVLEAADTGFAEAWTLASRHAEEPERANMLGQLRHACCEAGFRRAARD